MREHVFLKLWPIASGNHGDFDDAEKLMQECRHFDIKRRFALGKCAVEIKNNELLHLVFIHEFLRFHLETWRGPTTCLSACRVNTLLGPQHHERLATPPGNR